MRPVVTRSGDAAAAPPDLARVRRARLAAPGRAAPAARTGAGGMTVRRLARDQDDGFQSGLVPGLKSAADAAPAGRRGGVRQRSLRIGCVPIRPVCTRRSPTAGRTSSSAAGWRSRSPGCRRSRATTRSQRSPPRAQPMGRPTILAAPAAPESSGTLTGPRGTYDPATAATDGRGLPRLGRARRIAGRRVRRRAQLDARAALRPGLRAAGAAGRGPSRPLRPAGDARLHRGLRARRRLVAPGRLRSGHAGRQADPRDR